MFIHFNNHLINLDCVKSIDYAPATIEDLIMDELIAEEIADKCDNLKITFYFTDDKESHFFAEESFLKALKEALKVKTIDF
ncbi:MAG: hypothetical protein IKN12_05220 [Selenomonadaceae bacterium]|nr:hypothetical protein [Selenomonadaceae bacterium]